MQHYSRAVEYNQEEYSVLSPPPSSKYWWPASFLIIFDQIYDLIMNSSCNTLHTAKWWDWTWNISPVGFLISHDFMALIPYIFSYRYSTQRAAVESPHPQRAVTLDRRGRLLDHQESYLSADPLSDWKLWYRAFRWHSERWSHCGDPHLLDPSAQCRVPLAEKSVGMVTMKLSKWIIIQPADFLMQNYACR